MYMPYHSDVGSSGCDGATIAIIVIVSILVLALVIVLICQAVRPPPNGGMMRFFKKNKKAKKVEAPKQSAKAARPQQAVRAQRPVRAQHKLAPMPASGLHAPHEMPAMEGGLPGMGVEGGNLGDHVQGNSTAVGGVAASAFHGAMYQQDPNMMTKSTKQDMAGLDAFMPNMEDGKMTKNGPVDPSTGLPLHTQGKLNRAHALGGIGPGAFLQPEVDPMNGSRKLGKWMNGCQRREEAMAANRAQFNKARLESGNEDPVLWGVGEFAYF